MIFARYLLREFIKFYLSISTGFVLVYCVIDFLEKNTRYFPNYNAKAEVILEYYLVQMPKMFVDISPFAVMFGAILTFWIFARSGEIAALRAAGQSIRRICMPVVFTSAAIGFICLLTMEFVVPPALLQLQKIEKVKIEKSALSQMFLESQWVTGQNAILHFKKLNQLEHSLMDAEYVVFRGRGEVAQIVHAQRAVFDPSGGTWKLLAAKVSHFGDAGELLSVSQTGEFKTSVASQPPKLLREGISSDLVSFRELRQVLTDSKSTGAAMASRETDLYQKLSTPFANLIFAFFSFPFALRRERQADTYIGIVACLLAASVFWGSAAAMRAVAANGLLPSFVAAWLPTVLFLALGIALMLKVDRRS
ncbi:MAG: hypothetical protein RLZZ488_2579 [Pseudomonadota bacterium]|jgi:lipopolysaccharide export system permease protein